MNILDLFSSVNSVSSVLKSPVPDAPLADEFADTLDHLKLQAEHAQAMAQDSPNVFIKAATNIAAMDFFTVLNRFDTAPLSKRLEEKPELYFQMINTYVNFMRANLERQKFEFRKEQAKARQREREQKLRTRKPILLSDKSLDRFTNVLTTGPREQAEIKPSPAGENPVPPMAHPDPIGVPHSSFGYSSTVNTGDSGVLEFSVPVAGSIEMHVPVPEVKTPDDHDDTWREWREEHPDDLVCCPS